MVRADRNKAAAAADEQRKASNQPASAHPCSHNLCPVLFACCATVSAWQRARACPAGCCFGAAHSGRRPARQRASMRRCNAKRKGQERFQILLSHLLHALQR
jgi:hypothetical protein